jgi:primosomal protein N'
MILQCNVCEYKIELSDKAKPGERITCPNCFAQLGLYKYKGKFVLGCAICKEAVFDPNACAVCERNRERKSLLEEGKL